MEKAKSHYDVFISYARGDYMDSEKNIIPGNAVSKIKDALQQADITYWIDEEGIKPGDDFVNQIAEYMENSDILVFVSSNNSITQSDWTPKEIGLAAELGKLIIPIRIDNTPYGKCKKRSMMLRLMDIDYLEFHKNPDEALSSLVGRINSYKQEQKDKEEKRIKIEEERRKKEEEEKKRHKAEQEKLIDDIMKKCTAVNQEEAVVESKRVHLLAEAKDVTDPTEREKLELYIKSSGPIVKSNLKEIETLYVQVKDLEEKLKAKCEEIDQLVTQNNEKDTDIAQLKNELSKVESKLKKRKRNRKSIAQGADDKNDVDADSTDSDMNSSTYNTLRWLVYFLVFAVLAALCWFFIIQPRLRSGAEEPSVDTEYLFGGNNDGADNAPAWTDSMEYILKNLSTVAPQLQEYIDGYKNHDPELTHKLGKSFESGAFLEGNRNMNIAGHLVHLSANQGYAPAQTTLGFYFYHGRAGFTQDFDSSTFWYNEAIKNGSIDAKYYLGQAYATGRYEGRSEKAPNTAMAKKLYTESAEAGQASSQLYLGIYYYTDQNYFEAKKWIEKSLGGELTDNDRARGYFMMGQLYGTSQYKKGVTYDPEKAFSYYSKASTTGDGYVQAMYYMGICYENGKGTSRNLTKAREWYRKAADRGHQKSKAKLSNL